MIICSCKICTNIFEYHDATQNGSHKPCVILQGVSVFVYRHFTKILKPKTAFPFPTGFHFGKLRQSKYGVFSGPYMDTFHAISLLGIKIP